MSMKPKPYENAVKCPSCKGHGQRFRKGWDGRWVKRDCPRCFSTGWTSKPTGSAK
jgi:DnaJ-class molecular chaperone